MVVKQAVSECWDVKIPTVKKCELCGEKGRIYVDHTIYAKIEKLTEKVDNEWLGYLVGKDLGNGRFHVTDLSIPEQEVTGGSVDVDTDKVILPEGCIGVVHSHNNMGAFFSGTDDTYINSNHNASIVVNKKGEYKAKVDLTLPCNHKLEQEAVVEVVYPSVEGLDEYVEAVKEKIKERVYVAAPVGGRPSAYPFHWNQGRKEFDSAERGRKMVEETGGVITESGEIIIGGQVMSPEEVFDALTDPYYGGFSI